jgi:hypothetical protein
MANTPSLSVRAYFIRERGKHMRTIGDYTVGLVIVIAHLLMISLRGEEVGLLEH